MDRVSTYQVGTTAEVLHNALERGTLPPELHEPLRALVQRVTHVASERPLSVYLFSSDASAEVRDLFAYALARALRPHVPSTLVVDCDFLAVGMHGVVPQKDALGFLDLLLYGSSIGVITQEAPGGVRVVGAGSFPVTKRMPFVMGAFEDASRRLAKHARCVIFTGPLDDDERELHPLIGAADVPVLVRGALEAPALGIPDPVEEQVAEHIRADLISVRVTAPAVSPPDVDEVEAAPASAAEPPPEHPVPDARPAAAEPAAPETAAAVGPATPVAVGIEDFEEPRFNATLPRVIVGVFVVIVIASVVWWVYVERTSRGTPQTLPDQRARTSVVETPPETRPPAGTGALAAGEPAETLAVAPPEPATAAGSDSAVAQAPSPEPGADALDPADTGGGTGGTVLIPSEDILVMDDLIRDWTDSYVVHISSFKESVKARDEVGYLESQEFSVFIVFLDLGAKGKWYRVYSGPFQTRQQALNVKKNLDDTPGVRFTRVSKVTPR
jgi:hypothetical protein